MRGYVYEKNRFVAEVRDSGKTKNPTRAGRVGSDDETSTALEKILLPEVSKLRDECAKSAQQLADEETAGQPQRRWSLDLVHSGVWVP